MVKRDYIADIEKALKERTIRKNIQRLDHEGFIIKKVEAGKMLKYVYTAVPIQEAWKKVEGKIQEIFIG